MATALQDLDQSRAIDVVAISCENGTPWTHGSSLINYMRPITFQGITGSVSFDQLGFRSSFTLDVMTLNEEDLQKIGVWNEKDNKGLNINKKWLHHYERLALENKTLIVTTILNEPYTMLKQSGSVRSGNERYEGIGVFFVLKIIYRL